MTRSLLVCLKENRGLGATVFEILSVAIYPALLTLPYCTMRLGLQEHIEAAASASHIIRSLALFSIAFGLSPNAVAGKISPLHPWFFGDCVVGACTANFGRHAYSAHQRIVPRDPSIPIPAVETILHVKIELLLELALGFQDQVGLGEGW